MNPATAYKRRAIESATPVGLVVLLYQAAVVDLRRALAAMENDPDSPRQIEVRTQACHRVLAIVGELKGALNFEQGGEVARNFDRFYQLAERLIVQAGFQKDPEPVRELLQQFSAILNAWREVEARPPAAPPVQAAWSA
jgi:flagellar protein FliS